jgi:RimJ/RimL family protein N-acetyltransferase
MPDAVAGIAGRSLGRGGGERERFGRPAEKRDIADAVSDTAERLQRFDRTILLRDGTRVRMRPIRADDAPRLVALYDHLSRDSRYGRFFSVMQRLPPDWARFHADVDYESRLALVVESPEDADTLIAVARYEPAGQPGAAEVAFVVQDDWQDRGLGTVLFSELLAAAQLNGIRRFRAWVLADNRRMLDLITRLGEVSQRSIDQGVVELTFTARPPRSSGS